VKSGAFSLHDFNHAVDPADADAEFFFAADSIAVIPSSFGALPHIGANITGYASAASIFSLTLPNNAAWRGRIHAPFAIVKTAAPPAL
jgi:hypothetical protein